MIALLPFSDDHVATWITHWNQISDRTVGEITEHHIAELAKTPILLLMIAVTWKEQAESVSQHRIVDLYEQFFQHIARGKYGEPGKSGDSDEHKRIQAAAQHLAKQIEDRNILANVEPVAAMLWLMARVAWEAHCYEYGASGKTLQVRHIERLIEDELGIDDGDVLVCIQVGLLLAMQIDPTGRSPALLFGHQSFREFLVARYWDQQLIALISTTKRDRRKIIEKRLRRVRLLQHGDQAFSMLNDMLRKHDDFIRSKLKKWARKCVSGDNLTLNSTQPDPRANLRESALAIGSHIDPDAGLALTDVKALRSLCVYYDFHEDRPRINAPRLHHRRCRLSGTNLHSANLRAADLRGADLRGANLGHADLNETNLRGADLRSADLRGANLRGANLCDATLSSANLHGANLRVADLSGADLSGADLSGTDLRAANFCDASLSHVSLRGATLHGADLRSTNLDGADLRSANLHGADLRSTSLDGADLRSANLHGANLRSAMLHEATLRSTDLHQADLREADLRKADLRKADLDGANLRGADFHDAIYDDKTVWPTDFPPSALGVDKTGGVPPGADGDTA